MERILIADDALVDRHILMALLDGEYEITECANGREVIERLEAGSDDYKCLLLDIRMPEVDGFGVLQYMREKGLIDRLPVIALTALTEAADQISCYRAGVSDLLEKPYNQDVLKYKVRYVIDRMAARGKVEPSPSDLARAHLHDHLGIPLDRCEPLIASARRGFVEMAAELRKAAPPYDPLAIRKIAHTLIGNSQNLGYTALYEDAIFLDSAAKAEFDKGLEISLKRTINRLESF